MPKPPLLGEVASSEAKMTERLYRAAPAFSAHSKGVLYPTSQSRIRSTAPLKRGAIDKEISFRSNTRCCDKTSPPQSLPLSGEVASSEAKMTERFRPHKNKSPTPGVSGAGGAGMESGNGFNRFCHRRRRCGSCHRRCRCTAPGRGRCAPRPPHRWGRGLQWQKPCSGSRCRPCR